MSGGTHVYHVLQVARPGVEPGTSGLPDQHATAALAHVESSGQEPNLLPPASEAGMPPLHHHSLSQVGGNRTPAVLLPKQVPHHPAPTCWSPPPESNRAT